MNTSTITLPLRRAGSALIIALTLLLMCAVVAFAGGGHDKVGVCHRTASETNPYVYLYIPADEASGHITGTDKQHNEQVVWKSDGTWRGVEHKAGAPKLDYYANYKTDCEDQTSPPTTTTTTQTSPPTSSTTTTTTVPTTATSTTSQPTTSTTSTTSSTTTTSPPVTTSSTTSSPPSTTTTASTPSTTTSTVPSSTVTSRTQPPESSPASSPSSSETPPSSASPRRSGPPLLAFTGPVGNTLGILALACVLVVLGVWFWTRSRRIENGDTTRTPRHRR